MIIWILLYTILNDIVAIEYYFLIWSLPDSNPFSFPVTLAQTRKKGIEGKSELMDEVKKCVGSYANLFVFDVHNMRNVLLKELRNQWKPSRYVIVFT